MTVHPIQPVVWRPIRASFAFLADFIGPALHGRQTDESAPANPTAVALIGLVGAVGLLILAVAQGMGRRGHDDTAIYLFWLSVILTVAPAAGRMTLPAVARGERAFLLVLVGIFLFMFKVLHAPTAFSNFDEMLHWMTAYDVLHRHQLFLDNSLLPISPYYPALEILSTALANLIGSDVFLSGMLTLAILRGTFLLGLFLFFERITSSTRIAGIATIIYMGCSTFISFDAAYAYESLAVVLCILVMLAETRVEPDNPRSLIVMAMLIATLAVTHHMTALWCGVYLTLLFGLHALHRTENRRARIGLGFIGIVIAFAIGLPFLWMNMRGNPLVSYMGPVLEHGVDSMLEKISGHSEAREMFVSEDGTVQPLGNRLIGIGATLLITIGLATGFFRSLAYRIPVPAAGWRRLIPVIRREWGDSRIILLTLGAFGFPVSVAFRLSVTGWEIGNRMNTFVFFSVGLVLAISLVHFWNSRVTRSNTIPWFVVTAIVMGGVILGSPRAIRTTYKVSADADSIEYMGIDTARWTREWLGSGNRFVADRVNRTLLGTYGDQNILSSLGDGVDETRVFLNKSITPDTLWPIRKARVQYLYVDLRLTTAKAVLGEYYARFEPLEDGHPPSAKSLLKFDDAPEAARPFDNGYIVIYDVRGYYHE